MATVAIGKVKAKSKISAHRNYRGRDRSSDAEGATAPETLRQTARDDCCLYKEEGVAPADGIPFSGKHTEGAPTPRRNRRHKVLQCGAILLSFVFDRRGLPFGGGAHERSSSKA